MRQRSSWPWWLGIGVLLVFCLLLYLRAKAPPQVARLLPESDAILYANLKPLRSLARWTDADTDATAPHRSPELQDFIDKTGIVPERDLDKVALALHRMPDPHGPNGPVAYSEVFSGHFNAGRLRDYLKSLAANTELYGGREIYNIPVENRTLRVAVIAYDMVAASNTPTAEQIHSILDRSRAAALWRPGSSLLASRFQQVPLLAQAWGIGRIGLPFAQNGLISVMGFSLPVPVNTELIASVRYSGSVHLRVEEIAPDALSAQHTADAVESILSILRGLASAQPPRDPRDAAMRNVLSTTRVTQHADRAILTATATLAQTRLLSAMPDPPSGVESTVPIAEAPTHP